jgi:hypothetical protein
MSAHNSTIDATDSDASGAATYGYVVDKGSFIASEGGTGTRSEAVNALTSDGIIFG